jgi:hypothetical protein
MAALPLSYFLMKFLMQLIARGRPTRQGFNKSRIPASAQPFIPMIPIRIGSFANSDKGRRPVLFLQESPSHQTGDFPTGDRIAIVRNFVALQDRRASRSRLVMQGWKCRDQTFIGTLPRLTWNRDWHMSANDSLA